MNLRPANSPGFPSLRMVLVLPIVAVCCFVTAAETQQTPVHTVTFENGLRLVVVEDSARTLVEILQHFDGGSVLDPPGKEGLAHLVEHFMAGGWNSETRLRQRLELLSLYRNASTSLIRTVYETWCTPESFREVLELEANRLIQFDPTDEIFQRERFVVRQEHALRNRWTAARDLRVALQQAALADSVYGRPIGGTDSSLVGLTREDVLSFHRQHIAPPNLVLRIIGPLRASDVTQVVAETFGAVATESGFQPHENPPLPPPRRSTVRLDRPDESDLFACIGFRLPSASPGEYLLALLSTKLLEGVRQSTWRRHLPGEQFWGVQVSWVYSEDPDGPGPERLRALAWESMWEELRKQTRILARPDSFKAKQARVIEDLAQRPMTARSLDPRLLFEFGYWQARRDSVLRAIKHTEVLAFIDSFITSDNSASGVAHGRGSRRRVTLDLHGLKNKTSWGSPVEPPAPMPAVETEAMLRMLDALPNHDIERRTLSNGIPVFMVPFPAEHRVRVGGARTFLYPKQARKKPGLMRAYNLVVDLDFSLKARRWKRLSYGINFDARSQTMTLRGYGAPDEVPAICGALLERIVEREFNVATWQMIRDYPSAFIDPRHYSKDILSRVQRQSALLGADHPILGDWSGDPKKVKDWKYNHLGDVHKHVMQSRGLRLVVTGPFEPDELSPVLNGTFGKHQNFRVREEFSAMPTVASQPQVMVVSAFDRRDARVAFSLQPLPQHLERNWATIQVMRHALNRKLFDRLRYQEGLSYTVSTHASWAGDDILFELYVSTFPSATDRVVAVISEELDELKRNGLDVYDFQQAQMATAKEFLLAMDDASSAFYTLRGMLLFGDIPADPVADILDVDFEDCARLMDVCINPESHVVSVCGPILEEEAENLLPLIAPQQ